MIRAPSMLSALKTGAAHARPHARALSTHELEKHMATTYSRPPVTIVKGRGSRLWDSEGNEYVDFTAGIAVTALGHADPELAEVAAEQARKLVHCSNLYYNEWAPHLSRALVEHTVASGGMPSAAKVFLCNSGSEANEAALKFARKASVARPDKTEFVAFKGGFHGRTYGALTATCNPKYQAPFAPMVPGFNYGEINQDASLDLITSRTSAVIVEPIQGEGGVNESTPAFLRALRARCDEHGALLIYDEIQCGLGRSGDLWAHAAAGPDAQPDIVTMAKALGNGFPIGATMVSEKVNDALKVGDHGTTYGGNPLASRIGLSVLERLVSPFVRNNVAARSQQIRARVERWRDSIPSVLALRGRGLILGVQLARDPAPVVDYARRHGLLVITCGTNTLRIVPPLVITEEETARGLDVLEKALKFTEK